ncbi:hypothetical protein BASA81_000809 [Batrachochytrium salamandrivorans]|nr:hypothetical protein BASA81_000809 [Batrachochytrium salamandrivorans]
MMILVLFAIALMAVFSPRVLGSPTYCNFISPPVPLCTDVTPRDLVFLVDGSDSISPDRFYTELLDYTQALYCAFDPNQPNQAAMVVFNGQIRTMIDLAQWTQEQWFTQVEAVRATRDTANEACCSCCTPTAEAFDRAREMFLAKGKNPIKIAFMITDGVPSNNFAGSGGNPEWWFVNAEVGFNPAEYNAQIVAQEASLLKNITGGARVFLVGVPNIDGNPPDINFFQGTGRYARNPVPVVLFRAQTRWTFLYRKPPNPIVSSPITSNAFSSNTFDVQSLVTQTVGALCEVTSSPTPFPTFAPTVSPTPAPTLPPTEFPTFAPTVSPTPAPTLPPTEFPTPSPTVPFLDQVDLTFLIDRSNSMNFQASFCLSVIATLPRVFPNAENFNSSSPCWELFLRYVLQQTDDIVAIRTAGQNHNRLLGWADDFTTPGHGLRVQVLGFACTGHQTIPLQFNYSDNFTGGTPITSRRELFNLLEFLRVNVLPFGGTCPYLAIEQSIKYVERSPFATYPYQTVILVTDGVFYDAPAPSKAVTGLREYKAVRFTIGIAVAQSNNSFGMTRQEIATQAEQLTEFVSPDQLGNFKNLGTQGWALLTEVAHNISTELPVFLPPNLPIPRYSWCGFRRRFNCASDDFRLGNCTWINPDLKNYGCRKL